MATASNVLDVRDFRLVLAARLCDALGSQMLGVVVAWQIYQLSHAPLPLGLIGLAEGLPFMAAALWAGHMVDLLDKKRVILAAEAGIWLGGAGLLALAFLDRPPLWALYACLAWGGFARSFLFPAQSTYVQMTVRGELFPKAAAWTTGVLHAATIGGPALGGLLYDFAGPKAAYGCVAGFFFASLLLASRLAPMPSALGAVESSRDWRAFLEGARFVWREKVMLAAMSLDMFGVLFGGVEGVFAMFAVRLGVGASGLGLLQAAPAAGALLTSLVLAARPSFKRTGLTFVSVVAIFGCCIIAFACSTSFPLSCFLLALGGAVDCVGMILRSSIYQVLTPDRLRGRVAAVNGIFIRSSNEIGAFESGLAAKLLGLVPSAIFGGCMTLVSVAVALGLAPELARFELDKVARAS